MAIEIPQTYIRHQGPTTDSRVFPGSPGGAFCLACDREIAETESTVLVPIGCGDPENQEKMRNNGWVSARALIVHAACAGREMAQ